MWKPVASLLGILVVTPLTEGMQIPGPGVLVPGGGVLLSC